MKDLLGNVKLGAGEADEGIGRFKLDGDVEMGETSSPSTGLTVGEPKDKAMQDFFREVSTIKKLVSQINQRKRKMQELHEQTRTISRSNVIQKIRADMQGCIDDVNKNAQMCKKKLELLDSMNEAATKAAGTDDNADARMRSSVTVGLKRKLKDVMGDFQKLRQSIQDEYRDVVERRIYTVTGEKPSEEDVDRMVETGEGETIFKRAILEAGRGNIKDTLAEIQERHSAVKELERSLLELHQIFLDMAVLVEQQGEMLNNIEAQVAKSVDYVAKGTEVLVKAKELQKNTRKYMCWAMICLAILAVIIFVVLGSTLRLW